MNRTAKWDWSIVLSISVSVLIWLLGVLFLIAVLIGAITHFRWYSFIVIPIALLILLLFFPLEIQLKLSTVEQKLSSFQIFFIIFLTSFFDISLKDIKLLRLLLL